MTGSSHTDDVVALHQLQSAYADTVTRRAWSELAGLLRPDCRIELELVTSPTRTVVGPEELTAFVGPAVARFDHFTFAILNRVVAVDGDAATGRIFMCEVRHEAATDEWTTAHGLYQDRYVRHGGRWWIAGRRYRSLARQGPGGVVLGLPDDVGPPMLPHPSAG